MHLGCYGRGGPLSPCANSRQILAENQRRRLSVRANWWRAFSFQTRGHVLICGGAVFFVQARGTGTNFCVVLYENCVRAGGWPLWARTGCIHTGTTVFGRVLVRSFEIGATCRSGCLPFRWSSGFRRVTAGAHGGQWANLSRRVAGSWPLATKIRPSPDDDSVM